MVSVALSLPPTRAGNGCKWWIGGGSEKGGAKDGVADKASVRGEERITSGDWQHTISEGRGLCLGWVAFDIGL
jgi:hypothetical protein